MVFRSVIKGNSFFAYFDNLRAEKKKKTLVNLNVKIFLASEIVGGKYFLRCMANSITAVNVGSSLSS